MDDKTLVERLRQTEGSGADVAGIRTIWYRNPEGPEAADTIEAQATRIEALEAALREMSPSIEWLEQHEYNPFEPDNQGPAFAEVMKLSAIHAKALEGSGMTIEQKAREIADQAAHFPLPTSETAARLGIIEGLEMAAKALQDDAKLCDCSAYGESECACGAWCEWKTIPSHRAVEIVRALIEEQKL